MYLSEVAHSSTKITRLVHGADPISVNNGSLSDKLTFVRTGGTIVCDLFNTLVLYGNTIQQKETILATIITIGMCGVYSRSLPIFGDLRWSSSNKEKLSDSN